MNRKSAGILLSVATVAVLAAILCRPSAQPLSPERQVKTTSIRQLAVSTQAAAPALPSRAGDALGGTSGSGSRSEKSISISPAAGTVNPADGVQEDDSDLPPGAKVDQATLVKLHGNKPLNVDHPHVKAAIEVQERNTRWLMALPAVVGTAIGLNDDGEVALVVYTKAETTDVPKVIDGLPVVAWKTGQIASRHGVAKEIARPEAKPSVGKPQSKPIYQTEIRPVPIGVSTSLTGSLTPGYWTAGTLGCRVKHNVSGATFALSNYHVYTFDGVFTPGGVVLQPGTLDSRGTITDGSDYLGNVSAVAAPNFTSGTQNEVDAAIATTSILGVATFDGGYGTPSSITSSASLNASVVKCGRTTGYTQGVISQINAQITVQYDEGLAVFVHQIGIVKPARRSPSFSDSGDSGSLIVVSGSNSPVGLLFAGGSNSTFANPIGAVLTAFNVKVDDGK